MTRNVLQVGAGDNRQHLANPLTDRRSDRTSHEARADLTDEFIICTAVVVDAVRKIFADVDLAIRVRCSPASSKKPEIVCDNE